MSSWIPPAIDLFLCSPLQQNLKIISLFLVVFSSHSVFNPLDSDSVTGLWLWPHHDTKTFSRYQRPPFYQIEWSVLDVSLFDFSAVFPTADDCLFKYFIHLASRINFFLVCLHLTWPRIFITLLSFSCFHPWHLVVPGVWLLTFSLPSLLFCFLPIHILPSFLMLPFSLLSYTLDPC